MNSKNETEIIPKRPIIEKTSDIINRFFPNIKEENKIIMSRMLIEYGLEVIDRCADKVIADFTQQSIKKVKEELI